MPTLLALRTTAAKPPAALADGDHCREMAGKVRELARTTRSPCTRYERHVAPISKFALESPLEGEGFEPSVPVKDQLVETVLFDFPAEARKRTIGDLNRA